MFDYMFKLNKYKSCEGQIIQVKKGENLTTSIIIGNIYRPPNELMDPIMNVLVIYLLY